MVWVPALYEVVCSDRERERQKEAIESGHTPVLEPFDSCTPRYPPDWCLVLVIEDPKLLQVCIATNNDSRLGSSTPEEVLDGSKSICPRLISPGPCSPSVSMIKGELTDGIDPGLLVDNTLPPSLDLKSSKHPLRSGPVKPVGLAIFDIFHQFVGRGDYLFGFPEDLVDVTG